jgi:hypothetical protein
MYEMLPLRAERNNIKLALVATLGAASDLDVAAHKVTSKLVPLSRQFFEVVHGGANARGKRPRNAVRLTEMLAHAHAGLATYNYCIYDNYA